MQERAHTSFTLDLRDYAARLCIVINVMFKPNQIKLIKAEAW